MRGVPSTNRITLLGSRVDPTRAWTTATTFIVRRRLATQRGSQSGNHQILVGFGQARVKRKGDGVVAVVLGFRKLTATEAERLVVRLEMNGHVMDVHADSTCPHEL